MSETNLKPADVVKDNRGDKLVVLWADNEAGDWMAVGWPHVVGRIPDVTMVRPATGIESRDLIMRVREGFHPYRDKVLRLHSLKTAVEADVIHSGRTS